MVAEDPAPAMAKQGLSGAALDDPDAQESEAVGRHREGVRAPITRPGRGASGNSTMGTAASDRLDEGEAIIQLRRKAHTALRE